MRVSHDNDCSGAESAEARLFARGGWPPAVGLFSYLARGTANPAYVPILAILGVGELWTLVAFWARSAGDTAAAMTCQTESIM